MTEVEIRQPDLLGDVPPLPFGLTVQLNHNLHHTKCGELATIIAGKGPHVAALQCLGCDGHRGWLALKEFNFINALVARYGPPTEAIVLRNWPNGDENMEYDNSNSGALFKNEQKETDKHSDYRGTLNVGGEEFWISGWLKTSKKGTRFMSLAVKPKTETAGPKPEFNDSIEF